MTKIAEPLGGGVGQPTPHKLSTQWKALIIAVGIILIATLYFISTVGTGSAVILTPTHIQQTFIDIDADGDIDLVVSAEVIYNEGQENFPQGQ